eukprot:SAG31_NODE_5310_length_2617_cov_3.641384_3_plen_285_part_00
MPLEERRSPRRRVRSSRLILDGEDGPTGPRKKKRPRVAADAPHSEKKAGQRKKQTKRNVLGEDGYDIYSTSAALAFDELEQHELVQTLWADDGVNRTTGVWYPAFVKARTAKSVEFYYPLDDSELHVSRKEYEDPTHPLRSARRVIVAAGDAELPLPFWLEDEHACSSSVAGQAIRQLPIPQAEHSSLVAAASPLSIPSGVADIFLTVRYLGDGYGRCRADEFLELPPREEFADYYRQQFKPIALNSIEKKIRRGGYTKDVKALGVRCVHFFVEAVPRSPITRK